MNKKINLADKVEIVFDLVDRGDLNSPEEVVAEFEGYNIDRGLLEEIVREEFEEGFSERWEELVEGWGCENAWVSGEDKLEYLQNWASARPIRFSEEPSGPFKKRSRASPDRFSLQFFYSSARIDTDLREGSLPRRVDRRKRGSDESVGP